MASQGCLETDPAGHRTGRLFADIDPAELPDSLSEVAVTYNLSAGQAAIHHVMMPHSSTPNRSEHWRRVLIFRCLDADRELGPGTYHDYRTNEPFEQVFYLVRGRDVNGKGLPRSPV